MALLRLAPEADRGRGWGNGMLCGELREDPAREATECGVAVREDSRCRAAASGAKFAGLMPARGCSPAGETGVGHFLDEAGEKVGARSESASGT